MIKLNDKHKTIVDTRKIDLLNIAIDHDGAENLMIVMNGLRVDLDYHGEKPLCEHDYNNIKKSMNG